MLNPSNLTRRKKDIYLYLQQCIATKGYPPSVREIGEAVGLRSSSTVHRYLAELENDGFIIKDPSKPRAITLVSVDDDTNVIAKDIKTIPLVGEVAAGSPILAVENIEEIYNNPLDRKLLSEWLQNKHLDNMDVEKEMKIEEKSEEFSEMDAVSIHYTDSVIINSGIYKRI